PLDCALAEPWVGPRPDQLQALSDDAWRTLGDTRERLELFAAHLISQTLNPPKDTPGPCGSGLA
ncbi:MAG TPA: hypothetical protein DIW52_05885, partial [Pseudomonas sp.]|nr:hypothetical protein [Pseudomonas sp.]